MSEIQMLNVKNSLEDVQLMGQFVNIDNLVACTLTKHAKQIKVPVVVDMEFVGGMKIFRFVKISNVVMDNTLLTEIAVNLCQGVYRMVSTVLKRNFSAHNIEGLKILVLNIKGKMAYVKEIVLIRMNLVQLDYVKMLQQI